LIKEGSINENHKKYILEELLDSLRNDIVIHKYIDEKEIEKVICEINSSSDVERDKVLDYLKVKISDYDSWCKEYLRELVIDGSQKETINRVLKSYIPGLIGAGYDRDFIYHFNEKVFSLREVSSVNSLDIFLNRFDYYDKKFDVFIPLKRELEKFKDLLSSRLRDLEIVKDNPPLDFKINEKKYFLVKVRVDALEENSAAACAFERLNVFFRFYKFLGNNLRMLTYPKGMVVNEDGEHVCVTLKKNSYSIPMLLNSDGACDIADNLILSISESSDDETLDSIEKVFDLHNSAIRAGNLKNGFLNFWSILEIVFVDSKEGSKIENIEKKLLPILQMDFIKKLSSDLDEKLHCNIGEKIDEMRKSIGVKENDSFVNALLVSLNKEDAESEKYLEELKESLVDYPLLRYRVNEVKNLFSSKESLRKELHRMNQRLVWHIRRLYRTRNSIIHSGEDVPYLKDLGEHLHNYIDVFMICVLMNLPDLSTISNVILECRFKYDLILSKINGKDKINENDIESIAKLASF
ncbi:MAG: hypothetical protein MJZ05_13500, partial [Fibrobacter sp.]|nr:hypothetical protein [Fibrobacter sp.]